MKQQKKFTMTYKDVQKIFLKWERQYRKDPRAFLLDREKTIAVHAQGSTNHFFRLLREVQAR